MSAPILHLWKCSVKDGLAAGGCFCRHLWLWGDGLPGEGFLLRCSRVVQLRVKVAAVDVVDNRCPFGIGKAVGDGVADTVDECWRGSQRRTLLDELRIDVMTVTRQVRRLVEALFRPVLPTFWRSEVSDDCLNRRGVAEGQHQVSTALNALRAREG